MILFVCEGNVCRSPLAQALLGRALAESGISIGIASAGTRALVGSGVDASTALLAGQAGLDLAGHRARQLDIQLAAAAGLLLTATRRIRSSAVELYPPAVQYAFTIRQLGRILTDAPGSSAVDPERRVADVRTYAIRRRGLRYAEDASADDIVDPYRRPLETHAESVAQLVPALDALSRALGGPPIGWP